MNAITALPSTPHIAQGSGIDAALLNDITFHTHPCQELLQNSLSDSIDYSNAQIQIQARGKSCQVQRGIRMIRQVLVREKHTRKLELRFKSHLDALEVCLVAIGILLPQCTADKLFSRHVKLDRTADEILTSTKVDRRSYPNQLGYTWRGDTAGETIFFEDVLGRQLHLPIDSRGHLSRSSLTHQDFSGEDELVGEERGLPVTQGEKAADDIMKSINRDTLSKVDA